MDDFRRRICNGEHFHHTWSRRWKVSLNSNWFSAEFYDAFPTSRNRTSGAGQDIHRTYILPTFIETGSERIAISFLGVKISRTTGLDILLKNKTGTKSHHPRLFHDQTTKRYPPIVCGLWRYHTDPSCLFYVRQLSNLKRTIGKSAKVNGRPCQAIFRREFKIS